MYKYLAGPPDNECCQVSPPICVCSQAVTPTMNTDKHSTDNTDYFLSVAFLVLCYSSSPFAPGTQAFFYWASKLSSYVSSTYLNNSYNSGKKNVQAERFWDFVKISSSLYQLYYTLSISVWIGDEECKWSILWYMHRFLWYWHPEGVYWGLWSCWVGLVLNKMYS